MLCSEYEDEGAKQLSRHIRLFVNMLRAGKLITTDLVNLHHIMEKSNT